MIFPKSPRKRKTIAFFDVASDSVGGALLEAYPKTEKKPKILASFRQGFVFDRKNYQSSLALLLKSLNEVGSQMALAGKEAPAEVHFFIGSPWQMSQGRVKEIKAGKQFIFNDRLLASTIKDEMKAAEKSIKEKYRQSGEEMKIVTLQPIKIKLNGYATEKPLGKYAKSAEIFFYSSAVPKSILGRMEETVRKFFNAGQISFSTLPLAFFSVSRDVFPLEDFLLLQIGGEITEVTIVKGGIIYENISFPHGKNELLWELASSLKKDREEIESLFSLYRRKALDENLEARLRRIIEKAMENWLQYLRDSLWPPSCGLLPNAVVLACEPKGTEEIYKEILRKDEYLPGALMGKKMEVFGLESIGLSKHLNYAGEAGHKDMKFQVESVFINKGLN